MKAVVQRVSHARLSVDGKTVSEIGKGLCVYFGAQEGDTAVDTEKLCDKISKLRVFSDENGKMNLGVKDVQGEILLISQFTLIADCSHGNRPSFVKAMPPDSANNLYEKAAQCLRSLDIEVKIGVFGADMKIEQSNDGPVTIILECADGKIL